MESDKNRIRQKWIKTKTEQGPNGFKPKWNNTKMESD